MFLSAAGQKIKKLLVLDYFADGYRFGVKPTGVDRTSVGYSTASDTNNLDYFNYAKTFPNGIPYGIFDGSAGANRLTYDLSNEITSNEDIVTIEFVFSGSTSWSFYCGFADGVWQAGSSSMSFMIYHNNGILGYSTVNGWRYPTVFATSQLTKQIFTNSTADFVTWHHYQLTKIGRLLICTVDGSTEYMYTDAVYDHITTFSLFNCVLDANNSSTKIGSYKITQLAIYKWINTATPFTLSKTLWIDTPECPSAY